MYTKYLFLLAAQKSSGQTTIAYNLGIAMKKQGKRVLLISFFPNERLVHWISSPQDNLISLSSTLKISPGLEDAPDFLILPYQENDSCMFSTLFSSLPSLHYDMVWFLMGNPSISCLETLAQQDFMDANLHFLLCTTLETPQTSACIRSFLATFQKIWKSNVDLVIPNKLKVREWESNSRQLLEIGEWLGYEKMADMLPMCERIHDLPLEQKTVWQLPVDQIRLAFQKLLDVIDTW